MSKTVISAAACCLLSIYVYYQYFNSKGLDDDLLFTADELKLYNGVDKDTLYLALLGNIFDVTIKKQHYGPGEAYNAFIGKDNSQAFVTGKFEPESASDKIIGFSQEDLRALNHWLQFYHKDYTYVGKLIGLYYDTNGNPTPYGKEALQLIKEAEEALVKEDLEKHKFPPCNVEWEANKGTRFWCTKKSGGITRDWVGVPRQLYETGAETYRCACIKEDNVHLGNIKPFDGCELNSDSCYVKT